MLDDAILEQLREVFKALDRPVTLRLVGGSNSEVNEAREMLSEVATSSDKIRLEHVNDGLIEPPIIEVIGSGASRARIKFRGVPGGHEFSSLVIAILNSDLKGKMPDEGILSRIRSLKGPIRLKAFVSLTCENCPGVVQALNLMAIVHPDFEHETVDGGIAQREVADLGIQGVPAVFREGTLIHSGKATFLELLEKCEKIFGKINSASQTDLGDFEVVVVGGGPAGASAAIYLARKGLKTALVAERFGGQLQDTKGIENMISIPYTEGVRLSSNLSEHVQKYPIQILEHRRVSEILDFGDRKKVICESGEVLQSRIVVIATGAQWRRLGIPGEKENIGQGIAFCAHCDGPFYSGKRVVVVGGGNSGVEAAIDLAGITQSVTLLEFGEKLRADDVLVEKLRNLTNTKVLTKVKATQVLSDGQRVIGLEYEDLEKRSKHSLEVDGIFVQIGLLPNSQFAKGLLSLTDKGEIVVDSRGRTSVPGIYAAGDVTTVPFKQIVVAMGDGAKVALTAFEDRMHAV